MSTINTENLTLYANPKLYNGSRYVFYQTNRDYDGWLESFSESVVRKTVYFKSLTEDMELNSSVKDILKYTYGKLTNDGKDYYIFIDNIVTDQHGKSYISFSVDWWATEWAKIHPTKAHLTRKPTKPSYMPQPYTPMKVTYDSVPLDGNNGKEGTIMFTYIPSEGTLPSYISIGMLPLTERNLALVQNGYWYQRFNIPGADIKDCFIVPYVTIEDIIENQDVFTNISLNVEIPEEHDPDLGQKFIDNFNARFPGIDPTTVFPTDIDPSSIDPTNPDFSEIEPKVYNEYDGKYYVVFKYQGVVPDKWYAYYDKSVTTDGYSYMHRLTTTFEDEHGTIEYDGYYITLNDNKVDYFEFTINNLNITTDEYQVMGIQDWNSDSIWECPYGMNITSFKVRLITGISHIMLEFLPNGTDKNGSKLTGLGFSYDCRHPGLFVDSYQDYILKNRDYDIAMRQIQSEKQEWSSVASVFENIGFGMAFGQEKGARAAGIGGIIESMATYAINTTFDPKIQEQYDFRYARMTDQISLVGDSITDVYNEKENGLLQIYTLTMDDATKQNMDTDIEINGYVCNEYTKNLENMFNVGVIIKAEDIVIEGACCLEGKHQTVYRLQNGVEFI